MTTNTNPAAPSLCGCSRCLADRPTVCVDCGGPLAGHFDARFDRYDSHAGTGARCYDCQADVAAAQMRRAVNAEAGY